MSTIDRSATSDVAVEVELGALGLDRGGHLLVKRALACVPVGGRVVVRGEAPELAVHLAAWCRAEGHRFEQPSQGACAVIRGDAAGARWRNAERAGDPEGVLSQPSQRWGVAPRGASVEVGGPEFDFRLATREEVWAEQAARLYAQAAAAQWDPATALPWDLAFEVPDEVEDALNQVLTYLIENETAALVLPARFASQVHPHFREVMQLLAIQAADEARHIEVFTRRALLRRPRLGLSTVGGQTSLKTLIDEPDFAEASFLLSVLGEGSFLNLLWFLHENAPEPLTKELMRLAAQDEARHVAFSLAHLGRHTSEDPGLRARLAAAVRRRHGTLEQTAGLNAEVFDALVLLAAGGWEPEAIARGFERVQALERAMDEGRRKRLQRLGFGVEEAAELSSLHTRNFM